MNQNIKNIEAGESNLFQIIAFRFFPYWPLLAFFIIVCFIGAIAYLNISLPTYEATATLLLKDEKKGSDDSRMMDDLNFFGSKKIVENEIEVIRSRALMKEVVKTLGLYAPVSMKRGIRSISAYTSTPVNIEVKEPEKIIEEEKIYFTHDSKSNSVKIGTRTFPMKQWVVTPYGELRFTVNDKLKKSTTGPLYFSLFPSKKVVNELLKHLNITAANKLSSVVNLQFVDEVPERAEDILNELIKAYNSAGMNDKNALADNTKKFVLDRLKRVQFELDSIERQAQIYRSEQGAVNLSEQSSLFLKNVGDNDQKVSQITMQLAILDEVQKFVNAGKSKGTVVPSNLGIDDPLLTQLLQQLSNAEIQYEKLRNTTAENNPVLISLANEIERIRPSIIESIRVQRMNLSTSRNQLNETNKKYSETLQSLPEKERKLLEISRHQTNINNEYNFLLQKKEETALSYASTLPDSRILDVAESSIRPVSPKKIIAFPAALFLAFLLTFSIVLIKDFASNKILFRSEIETLTEFPVVGEIAYVKKDTGDKTKKEFITQQFFQIIASIGLFNKNNSKKKLLITSSISGEGKSFISKNLATTLAEAGKKVVLVDLDLRNPTISRAFKTEKTHGVTEFLMEEREVFDIVSPTEYDNVFVVRAGELHSNYTALFSSNRLETLFSFLEQNFDFIIIDTSPIDPVTDALILSQFSDITLFVLRHAFTPRALFQLQNQKKNLHKLNSVGIIFNGVKPRGFSKGYGYGYDYSYEYTYKQISVKKNLKKGKKELVKEA
jgi:tyrosine-protein kinase Etk/Wzc